ncbi:hypothetical protein EJ06DRAFT_526608 [Trichodelitschia bisporula]|uniref:Uncharacterized protein n=1 Tax=Trichodelitschia bisporula TaxID=703511 RepID=A0A6G1I8B2_9PEZI|nr:hypothetical protein EJ06DRAFT_526608 [Trichodelitschia bisporula]
MYPKTQPYTPYHDTTDEEASVHGEDAAFLEKPGNGKKALPPSRVVRVARTVFSLATLTCFLSAVTAATVLTLFIQSQHHWGIATSMLQFRNPAANDLASYTALQSYHCGSTPAEARALGCVFDVMSFAWTPPACYDQSVSAAVIEAQGPWVFYLDHNATQPIPDSLEALSSEVVVWTEHSYHVAHCLYAWERIHRAYLSVEKLLPAEVGNVNHTLHCVGLLNGEQSEKKTVNAIAYMVFDSCVDLN